MTRANLIVETIAQVGVGYVERIERASRIDLFERLNMMLSIGRILPELAMLINYFNRVTLNELEHKIEFATRSSRIRLVRVHVSFSRARFE